MIGVEWNNASVCKSCPYIVLMQRWHADWNNLVIQAIAIKLGVDVAVVAI
jgi:hypothetical protein